LLGADVNKLFILFFIIISHITFAQCINFKINKSKTTFSRQALNNLKKIKPQLINNANEPSSIIKKVNDNLLNFAKNQGFFTAKIHTSIQQENCKIIKIHIKKNKVTKFNKISLTCDTNCTFLKQELSNLPIQKNKPFSSNDYNYSLNTLISTAKKAGYLNIEYWQSKIIIDPKKAIADVYFHFTLNKKHTIDKIITNNPKIINSKLLYNIINYYPNRPYSKIWLEQAKVNLLNSGYFNSVNLAQINKKNTSSSIKIDVDPINTATKILGIGYDTDTKLRALFGLKIPNLNTAGHKAQITSIIGVNESNANFKYIIPGKNPNKETWSFISHYENYLNLRFTSTKFWANNISYKYLSDKDMQAISINSRIEKEQEVANNKTVHAIYPEIQGYKTFDNVHNIFLRFRWMFRSGVSQTNNYNHFTQYLIGARSIIPLSDNQSILLTLNHGKTFTQNLNNIPISLQFVAGGGQSVRGYLFNELGPGKNLTNINYEYLFKINDPWHLGVFADTAKIASTWGNKWYQGIGVSFSFQSNIASVGLSIAKAISLPNKPIRIQLAVTA
jgi:translocation and assembly module TamA